MTRIGVIHRYKSPESLACVLKQFEKQQYPNKFLMVFDTSSTPLPFSTKYTYVNRHAELNTDFVKKSDTVVQTKNLINETSDSLKTTLAKIKSLENTISQMNKETDASALVSKNSELNALKMNVKDLEQTKAEANTNLQTYKTQVDNLVKLISDLRKKGENYLDDYSCMRMAVSDFNADIFTFMDECIHYTQKHLENGVRSFATVEKEGKCVMINRMFLRFFSTQSRLFMYDKSLGLEHLNMFFNKHAMSESENMTLASVMRSEGKTVIGQTIPVLVVQDKMTETVKNLVESTTASPSSMLIEYIHQMPQILRSFGF